MEADIRAGPPIRFGPFELDLESRELTAGDARIRLQDQPFEILRVMLERPGEVVTRELLRRRLWPEGTFVDFEHSLNAAVKRLRAALGDDAEKPRYVETLPRRGYRFIAPLNADRANGRAQAERTSSIVQRPSTIRLAVLPFANLSDARGEDYFSDGLTEEMIAQVGTLCRGKIGVLARSSSMAFKGTSLRPREIGEALRADYLLEGSVRRDGDRVRITACLVEADSETHLWADTYERGLGDCLGAAAAGTLSVQADVAARIARALAVELTPGDRRREAPAMPPAAYQALLKGRYFWNMNGDQGLDQSTAWFKQAVAAAPSSAAGYAALARAHVARGCCYRERPRLALEAARATAARALTLDRSQCEAFVALADASWMLGWHWSAAESAYAQAQALNPSYVAAYRCYAVMLAALARHDEAVRASERAFELDPLCLDAGVGAAWVRYVSGDAAAAIDYCRNTLDMDPDFTPARQVLGAACLQAGRVDEAIAQLRLAAAGEPPNPVPALWLAHALGVGGARSEARAVIDRVTALSADRYVPAYHLALAHAGLNDADAVFAALNAACDDRDPALANLAVEPRFAPMHADARCRRLVGRMGLNEWDYLGR